MLSKGVVAVLFTMAMANVDPEWEAFKKKYKKVYAGDADEKARYELFKQSKSRVASLNELNKAAGPAFGINFMSDRYDEEKYKKGLVKPKDFVPTAPVKEWETPARKPAGIDWRTTDAVTGVKNQGQCGSCWAFSATEAIESQVSMKTGGLHMGLSPQQITSCAPSTGKYGCLGCNGGFTEGAYEYLKTVAGLANEFFIPYAQSLTESSATMACPTTKVSNINGPMEQLQGGYAAVSGYSY